MTHYTQHTADEENYTFGSGELKTHLLGATTNN